MPCHRKRHFSFFRKKGILEINVIKKLEQLAGTRDCVEMNLKVEDLCAKFSKKEKYQEMETIKSMVGKS